jgi:hypothetical protein
MTGTSFAHLVRGLLVAVGLLIAVVQLGLLTHDPGPRLVEVIVPVYLPGR